MAYLLSSGVPFQGSLAGGGSPVNAQLRIQGPAAAHGAPVLNPSLGPLTFRDLASALEAPRESVHRGSDLPGVSPLIASPTTGIPRRPTPALTRGAHRPCRGRRVQGEIRQDSSAI